MERVDGAPSSSNVRAARRMKGLAGIRLAHPDLPWGLCSVGGASVILAARVPQADPSQSNYRILMMKRYGGVPLAFLVAPLSSTDSVLTGTLALHVCRAETMKFMPGYGTHTERRPDSSIPR